MEFRGKVRSINNRPVIEAQNTATNQTFFYSFEEDFFWFSGQIPDWKLIGCEPLIKNIEHEQ